MLQGIKAGISQSRGSEVGPGFSVLIYTHTFRRVCIFQDLYFQRVSWWKCVLKRQIRAAITSVYSQSKPVSLQLNKPSFLAFLELFLFNFPPLQLSGDTWKNPNRE